MGSFSLKPKILPIDLKERFAHRPQFCAVTTDQWSTASGVERVNLFWYSRMCHAVKRNNDPREVIHHYGKKILGKRRRKVNWSRWIVLAFLFVPKRQGQTAKRNVEANLTIHKKKELKNFTTNWNQKLKMIV